MWFVLADLLKMSVRQAQSAIDSREFAEWQAFFTIRNRPKRQSPAEMKANLRAAFASMKQAKPQPMKETARSQQLSQS